MISKTEGTGTTQFVWDFENRLTQVVTPSSGSVTYKYDALGRRIQRTPSSGISTNFIYDGQDVVKDINSDGTVVEYLNGPGIDNKIRQKGSSTSTTYYFTQDHLGSTTALTGTTGKLVERITYDAYGNSAGSTRTRYGYTGRERDQLTALLYYRARFYDAQLGRFVSEDPIGLYGGINMYSYVGNKVLNFKDPTGQKLFGVTGGGTAGAAVGGLGIIATGSYLIGYNTNCDCPGEKSIGGAGSIGVSAGDYGYPSNRDNSGGLGATIGAGGGLFWSNAPSYSALSGTFQTTIISLFGFGLEIDKSGDIIIGSLTHGKGWGAGIFHLTTNTPPGSTWDTKCTRVPTILL